MNEQGTAVQSGHRELPANPHDGIRIHLNAIRVFLREARRIREQAHLSLDDRRALAHDAREVGVLLFALIREVEGE